MHYLFSRDGRGALDRHLQHRVLFAFDFDGTLAPIVADPPRARARPETECLLDELASTQAVLILSGRSVSDLCSRTTISRSRLVGNHGLEYPGADPLSLRRAREVVSLWKRQLARWRSEHEMDPGIAIEDKGISLALHYRRATNRSRALRQLQRVLRSELQPQPRLIPGKAVLNLMPPEGGHKGLALRQWMKREGFDHAFFIGDDHTDEDVFALEDPAIFGVRVGRRIRSKANYFIQNQSQIDRVLELIVRVGCRNSSLR